MKVTTVLHFDKASGFINSESPELAANPSLSLKGFEQALDIAPKVKAYGPFEGMFTSRLARALDTASVLSLYLEMDFQTMFEFGQFGNKEGDKIVMYPGFEAYSYIGWQNSALSGLEYLELTGYDNVLIISHRPIIGALYAYAQDIVNETGIKSVVNNGLNNQCIFRFEYVAGVLKSI